MAEMDDDGQTAFDAAFYGGPEDQGGENRALVLREVKDDGSYALTTPAQSLMAHVGVGSKRFSEEQQKIIERVPEDEDIDILPTGEIYYGQVQYRRRLNEAFGAGGWGLVPVGDWSQDGETLIREYALIVEGRVVATGMGECDFQPNNPRFSKATAAEVVKSIALRRAAKDIGIADDCWDRRFIKRWLKDNAIQVWTVGVAQNNRGKKKPMWRRKDAEPFDYPWREDSKEQRPQREDDTAPVVLDPNAKWVDWCQKAAKKDRERFVALLGGYGFEKAEQVTDRKTQKEIFNEWNGGADAA